MQRLAAGAEPQVPLDRVAIPLGPSPGEARTEACGTDTDLGRRIQVEGVAGAAVKGLADHHLLWQLAGRVEPDRPELANHLGWLMQGGEDGLLEPKRPSRAGVVCLEEVT